MPKRHRVGVAAEGAVVGDLGQPRRGQLGPLRLPATVLHGPKQDPQAPEGPQQCTRTVPQETVSGVELSQCLGPVLPQQRQYGSRLAPDSRCDLDVATGEGECFGDAGLHLLGVAGYGVALGLADQGHRQQGLASLGHREHETTEVEPPGRFGAAPGGRQAFLRLEAVGQDGGDVEVDDGDRGQRPRLVGNLSGGGQPIESSRRHHVDGGQLLQRPDPPHH